MSAFLLEIKCCDRNKEEKRMFSADHYAISVGDVDKSIAFYEKLEFRVIKDFQR